MTYKPAIYVVTYHEFNHESVRNGKIRPLDPRFLESDKNYIYYLIDRKVPSILQNKSTILEYDLDPTLHAAGAKYFGEWSFLLAEEKHAFCQYPFFMISSRFYEKNTWLKFDLNQEWDCLFSYFNQYACGYLPSYDRPLRMLDIGWENKIPLAELNQMFFPFKKETFSLIENIFGIHIPRDYRYTADLFCNYIGFKNRSELLSYVQFYRGLIDFFFDKNYALKTDFTPYVYSTGWFRNEKPFTFLLEYLCHLYFFQRKENYFALHYDGYYSVDESNAKLTKIKKYGLPLKIRISRFIKWQWTRLNTEGLFFHCKIALIKRPVLHKICKFAKSLILPKFLRTALQQIKRRINNQVVFKKASTK